uniref:Uncharacterized protein n=1 Tax=Kalanchoe fedtschenkoi TaxID=63787 RepID=A0A7N0V4I7_KALFE
MAADEMKAARRMKRTRRRKSRGSRSLTELEFEEVKGFMDLGFVFSDEDHDDSSLVSIIPGLHRRGHHSGEEDGDHDGHLGGVSRPYLSEAWRCVRKETTPFSVCMGSANEAEMKNQIKFWAHSVASAIR